jgi:hypothetical protein
MPFAMLKSNLRNEPTNSFMEEADKSPSCLLGKPFKHATRKQVQSTKGPYPVAHTYI